MRGYRIDATEGRAIGAGRQRRVAQFRDPEAPSRSIATNAVNIDRYLYGYIYLRGERKPGKPGKKIREEKKTGERSGKAGTGRKKGEEKSRKKNNKEASALYGLAAPNE